MNYDGTPDAGPDSSSDDPAENRIDQLQGRLTDAEKRSLITLALDVLAELHLPHPPGRRVDGSAADDAETDRGAG